MPPKTDPGPDDSINEPTGPGQGPMSPGWILTVAIYLVIASIFVLYGLVKLWPYPTPSGEPRAQPDAARVQQGTTPHGVTPNQTTTALTQPAAATNAPASTGAGATNPAVGAGTAAQTTATASTSTAPVTNSTTASTASTAPQTTPQNVAPSVATAPPRKELPDPEVISFFRGTFTPKIYLETRLLLLVMLAGALGSLMHSLRSLYWYTGNRMMVWSWVGFYVLLPFTGAILAVIFYFVVRGGFFSPQASFENTSPFGFAALSALVGLFSPQATLKLKEIAETIFTKPPAGEDTKPQDTTSDANAETTPAATSAAHGDVDDDEKDVHDLDLKPDTPDEDLPITEGGVG